MSLASQLQTNTSLVVSKRRLKGPAAEHMTPSALPLVMISAKGLRREPQALGLVSDLTSATWMGVKKGKFGFVEKRLTLSMHGSRCAHGQNSHVSRVIICQSW